MPPLAAAVIATELPEWELLILVTVTPSASVQAALLLLPMIPIISESVLLAAFVSVTLSLATISIVVAASAALCVMVPALRSDRRPVRLMALLMLMAPAPTLALASRPIMSVPVVVSLEKSVVEIPSLPAVLLPRSISRPVV